MIGSVVRSVVRSVVSGAVLGGGGGGSPAFPEGALYSYPASTYVTTPVPQILNAANPGALKRRLNFVNRNLFNINSIYSKTDSTVTDNAATDIYGRMQAAVLIGTGNFQFCPGDGGDFPAGTYTFAVNVKRDRGSNQSFRLEGGFGVNSGTLTATSAWQRFAFTFTKGAAWDIGNCKIASADGITGANLQIDNYEIYEGSSDLGPEVSDAGVIMAPSKYNTLVTSVEAGKAIDLSTGGYGLMQLPDDKTFTAITVLALVKKIAAANTYQAILSKVERYQDLSHMTDENREAPSQYADEGGPFTVYPGFWRLLNAGWHVVAMRCDASNRELWLDTMRMHNRGSGMGAEQLRNAWIGILVGPSLYSGCQLSRMDVYDSKLTDAQMVEWVDAAAAELGIDAPYVERLHIAEGDSITQVENCHAFQAQDGFPDNTFGANLAMSGTAMPHLNARLPDLLTLLNGRRTAQEQAVVTLLIGANDLYNYATGAAGYLADILTWCAAVRAAGPFGTKVVASTVLPMKISVSPIQNGRRATVNTGLRDALTNGLIDGLIDYDTTLMGLDASAENPIYYGDGVHPTAAGYLIMEPVYSAAVDAQWV